MRVVCAHGAHIAPFKIGVGCRSEVYGSTTVVLP